MDPSIKPGNDGQGECRAGLPLRHSRAACPGLEPGAGIQEFFLDSPAKPGNDEERVWHTVIVNSYLGLTVFISRVLVCKALVIYGLDNSKELFSDAGSIQYWLQGL